MRKTAAMIGAGLIGRAWAMVFARAGWTVRLYDAFPDQLEGALRWIASSLEEQQASGLCDDATAAKMRIALVDSLEEAVGDALWIQEQLPEKIELKREMFARLDALAAPEAILASSTSGFPASRFTEGLSGRARCLVAHPVNPPHLVPVVELSGTAWTSPDVIERAQRQWPDGSGGQLSRGSHAFRLFAESPQVRVAAATLRGRLLWPGACTGLLGAPTTTLVNRRARS